MLGRQPPTCSVSRLQQLNHDLAVLPLNFSTIILIVYHFLKEKVSETMVLLAQLYRKPSQSCFTTSVNVATASLIIVFKAWLSSFHPLLGGWSLPSK